MTEITADALFRSLLEHGIFGDGLLEDLFKPRPIAEYHEDMGNVLWWKFPIVEPPYVGSPNDLGFEVIIQPQITLHIATGETNESKEDPSSDDLTSKDHKFFVGGWPGYHTHFTPIPIPREPEPSEPT